MLEHVVPFCPARFRHCHQLVYYLERINNDDDDGGGGQHLPQSDRKTTVVRFSCVIIEISFYSRRRKT